MKNIILILSIAPLFYACSPVRNAPTEGTSLMEVSTTNPGVAIAAQDAAERLQTLLTQIPNFSRVTFQAGASDTFRGSLATYPLNKTTGPNGKPILVRSSEEERVEHNGWLMEPPSMMSDHIDLYQGFIKVALNAIQGHSDYQNSVKVTEGASLGGSISSQATKLDQCLKVEMRKSSGYSQEMAFCGNSFFQHAAFDGGMNSAVSQMLMN